MSRSTPVHEHEMASLHVAKHSGAHQERFVCLRPEHWEALMVPAPHPNVWEGCVMKTGAMHRNSLHSLLAWVA